MVRIKRENLKRIKSKVKKLKGEFQEGAVTEDRFVMGVRSMFDHVGFADSFRLRSAVLVSRAGVG